MRQHHIGAREAGALGIIFVITKIFLPFPRTMAELGGTAGWMIVVIAALLSPFTWWAIQGILSNSKQGVSLILATEEIMGPILGSVINLAYFTLFFMITFIVLREFSEIIVSDILPRTPLIVILLCLLASICVLAHAGIETIGRISWLFLGIILSSIVVLLLGGLFSHTEPDALLPIWGTGLPHVLQAGIVKSSLFSELLVFGFLLPRMRDKQGQRKAAWWCIVVSSIIMISTCIVYLYVFPYPTAIRITTPVFELSRVIVFGRWIQRVEILFLVVWLLCTVIKLAIGLYCSATTLAHILHIPRHRPFIFPLALLVYSFSLLPPNEIVAASWDRDLLRVYGSILSIILPLLTWMVGVMRRKRGQQ